MVAINIAAFIANNIVVDPNATVARSLVRDRFKTATGGETGRNSMYTMLENISGVTFANGIYSGMRLSAPRIDEPTLDERIAAQHTALPEMVAPRRIVRANRGKRTTTNVDAIPEAKVKAPRNAPTASRKRAVDSDERKFTQSEVESLATAIAGKIVNETLSRIAPMIAAPAPKRARQAPRIADVEILEEISWKKPSQPRSEPQSSRSHPFIASARFTAPTVMFVGARSPVRAVIKKPRKVRMNARRIFNLNQILVALDEISSSDLIDEEGNAIREYDADVDERAYDVESDYSLETQLERMRLQNERNPIVID